MQVPAHFSTTKTIRLKIHGKVYIQNQFKRRTQEELENEASKKLNKGQEKNKKKTKRKKSIKN